MSIKPDVCLVVTLDDKDRFLVIRRSAKNSRAGNWECPLGHRDPGESATTAAHREVEEETGLKVKLFPKTFDKKSPDGKRIRVYLARVQGKTTVTTNPTEHDAHRWVPWNQLDSIDKCHDSFQGDVAKIVKLNGTPTKEASMLNTPSQRGFMPMPLMNNQYAASFPAGSTLPSNPNPLSKTQPVHATSADANGIQQAMAKRAMSSCNMDPSAAGEGHKKYKIDPAADAKGEDAFKSLDDYMKKAGLNSFQASFFSRLIQAGMGEQEIRQAIKLASARFGEKVASELNSGIEKIAIWGFAAKALPWLTRGAGAARAAAPTMQTATKAAPSMASRFGQGVKNYFTPQAAPAVNPWISAAPKAAPPSMLNRMQQVAQPALAAGSKLKSNIGTFAKSPVGSQALTGAATGALNPNTGLSSEDPSVLGVLGGAGAGALLGGLGGKYLPKDVGTMLQEAQRRSAAGAGLGYTAGMGANLMGYDVNPSELARYGQFAGVLPASVKFPGRAAPLNTTKALEAIDPMNFAMRNAGKLLSRGFDKAKTNMGTLGGLGGLAAAGGIGYGAMQVPGAIERGMSAMKPDETALANAAFENPAVQQRLGQLDQLIEQGGQTMQGVQQASQRANNMMGQFTDEQGNFSLGNMLGGLGGQAGQFFNQNQNWLIPLLLGGLGAAGGYGLGGSGGAALGGVGLPLAYMLMQNPQMLSSFTGSPQASVAAQQAAQQKATEDGRVQEFMQNPAMNVTIPQESIIQQQQRQQAIGNMS